MKKILGVIGGLGPLATAYFYELITKMTEVKNDQEHIEIIIHSAPGIPDRTAYILKKSNESPLPRMIEIGKELIAGGVGIIAIPCITAHYFHSELTQALSVPVINLPAETSLFIKEKRLKKVGIMATDGTVESGLFQNELLKEGLTPVLPSKERQADVMHLIYNNIKLGKPAEMDRFNLISSELEKNGADIIILGCTELSLIKRDENIGSGFLDAMEVLAGKAISECGGRLAAWRR